MQEDLSKYFLQIQNETDFFSKAKLIKFLIEKKGLRIVDIAKELNIKSSYVCHILRLNKISDLIVDGYYSKLITISHLFIISRLNDQEKMIQVYEEILKDNLTVLQTEEKVRNILHGIKSEGKYLDNEKIKQIIDGIKKKYENSMVKINQSRIKSVLKIEIKGPLSLTSKLIEKIGEKISQ